MKLLGLDIGTTSISAVVVRGGAVLRAAAKENDSRIPGAQPWEALQDPVRIREICMELVRALLQEHPDVGCIGVTGQMHGILYLDRAGAPVSPLYTWQDGRGEQLCGDGETYAARLSRLTGCPLASGYGMVTHFYNLQNGLVPREAAVLCTIHDYIAMLLAGRSTPVTEASDAASLGLFNVKNSAFDAAALTKAGIDAALLPPPADAPCIGSYRGEIPVFVAIGDNQASFLGATAGKPGAMLVNVGTGSQFSVFSERYVACPGLETRPFPGGGFLLVGASLCGGRAYALLEQFFRATAEAVSGGTAGSCYDAMERLLSDGERPDALPVIVPLFQGTRAQPQLRGSITGLGVENFTPRHFVWAMVEGIVRELYELHLCAPEACREHAVLVGSGNGLRRNRRMQECVAAAFGKPLVMSACEEEAAVGAALFALMQLR